MNNLNRIIISGLSMLAAASTMAVAETPETVAAPASETQKPLKKYYIQVVCSQSPINQKTTVEVNLGRMLPAMLGIPEKDLKQATSSRTFPTEIDAVNFYASKGWTLVDCYTINQGRATSVCYVMMFETADHTEVGVSILTH